MHGGKVKPRVITALRIKDGKSIRGLARETGIDPSYLSKVERGLKEPTPTVALRIANSLGVPLEAIWASAGEQDLRVVVLETTPGGRVAS